MSKVEVSGVTGRSWFSGYASPPPMVGKKAFHREVKGAEHRTTQEAGGREHLTAWGERKSRSKERETMKSIRNSQMCEGLNYSRLVLFWP